MSRLKLFGTNFLTALVTAAVTSLFWIAAYNQEPKAPLPPAPPPKAERELVLGPTGVAVPVANVDAADLADTYTQSRAGGARVHNAIDIMAPNGTAVIAAAPGIVEKLFYSNGGGGVTAYVRSPDRRWLYYYAHLEGYAPGLKEGRQVKRGDPIGTVGTTGNANPAGPHLHFAVYRMAPGEKWYKGTPINPYPLLAGTKPAG